MKIAIITLSCATNYGAMLQTYGLYKFLDKTGYSVQIIDYIPDRYQFHKNNYADMFFAQPSVWNKNSLMKTIWRRVYLPRLRKKRAVFEAFLCQFNKTTPYYSFDELKLNPPEADVYITGSDQVWNSEYNWNKKPDATYFLDFIDEKRTKISYASSFGKDTVNDDELNIIKPMLGKYKKLSVREETGKVLLEKMGLEAQVVADPTILCSKEDYLTIARKVNIMQDNYILLFMINFDRALYDIASKAAKEKGKKLVVLLPDDDPRYFLIKNKVVLPSVDEWLAYILHANYVITNSFHGTVFSTVFHKNFSSCTNIGNGGRMIFYLKRIGLSQRIYDQMTIEKMIEQISSEIDYSSVIDRIQEWQMESQHWLLDALNYFESYR